MKQFLIITFCLWNAGMVLHSQNYVAEYNADTKGSVGTLLFNATDWRYDVTDRIETKFSSDDIDVQDLNDDSSENSKTITMFNFRSLYQNYYLDEEFAFGGFAKLNKCVIKGELIKPEWTIVADSTKMIDDYTCLLAKGFLYGRNFTAWFTPDIPVSAGPWKLWGLPGLIVSARSDDGIVDISMTSLKPIDIFPTEPIVKDTITKEEYKSLFQKEIQKLKRSIRALSEGSMEVDVTGVNINLPDKSLME